MLPNYLVLPMLVANVTVFTYLRFGNRITVYAKAVRLSRQMNAYRVAGLL